AGTTGIRALAIDENASVLCGSYRELTQHFPAPGLVEHDAYEIWSLVESVLVELAAQLRDLGEAVAAIGLANQRESALAWDLRSGTPFGRCICWQDRRTAGRCEDLVNGGHLPEVRARTGLVLDSYFSATKWEWMLTKGGLEVSSRLALGTVDDYLLWRLTGGPANGLHATDPSNASRTLCYDIHKMCWSDELCALFGVPIAALGEVRGSCGHFGTVDESVAGGAFSGVEIGGIAGDQQAALFGQCCHEAGSVKVTYGTGSFVLMNCGHEAPPPKEGLLSTVAWQIEDEVVYALEGAVFVSGAALQWLRDGLGIIKTAAEAGPLAESATSNDGLYFVPALTGAGSPWWDPAARGLLIGISKGTGRAEVVRAAVEAMAYQTRDVLSAMTAASGHSPSLLRADGGAAAMDLLLQMQADQCRVRVARPATTEVTALGAAFLAGIAVGFWSSPAELAPLVAPQAVFEPKPSSARADAEYALWLRALDRALGWERPGDPR
ncbi:MAG: FGGY family carbohydrate kinase, partial [Acidimicrobiales bacterium]